MLEGSRIFYSFHLYFGPHGDEELNRFSSFPPRSRPDVTLEDSAEKASHAHASYLIYLF